MMNNKPEFSFVEYTFDPHNVDRSVMVDRLKRAGFVLRTVHNHTPISLWIQNQCIVFLREAEGQQFPCISGLGFIAGMHTITELGATYDPEIGMYRMGDTTGTRILFFSNHDVDDEIFASDYSVVDTSVHDNTGLNQFSGIIMSGFTAAQMDFYQRLGFKFVRSTDKYNTLLSNNNRFTIHLNKCSIAEKKCLITDTHDVFNTSAKMYLNNLKPDRLDTDLDSIQENFGSVAHRIIGYNCYAHGNSKSYSIENIITDLLPNTDLLFRTRKKQLEISEKSLEYFYGNKVSN